MFEMGSTLELFPRPWGRVLALAAIVLMFVALRSGPASTATSTNSLLSTAAVLALTGTLLLRAFAMRHPIVIVGVVVSAVVLMFAGSSLAVIGVFAAVLTVAGQLPPRAGAAISAGLALVYVAATSYVRPGTPPLDLLFSTLGLAFGYLLVRSIHRLREEQQRTAQLLAELQASRDAQLQAAALRERTRIAREIHDILAHTLSGLALQLEGARLLLEQRPGDPEAAAMVERAHRLARGGLEETRRAVSALRGDQLPGPEGLARLAEAFQAESGTPTEFHAEGEPAPLPSEAQLALYRTAQEALTNARKHARPTRVAMRLRYTAQGAELTVEDQASDAAPAGLPSGGYGLAGMRERAELLGGSLEAGPTERGFTVRLWLPT